MKSVEFTSGSYKDRPKQQPIDNIMPPPMQFKLLNTLSVKIMEVFEQIAKR